MKFATLALISVLTVPALAGKVITYTAVSAVSQEDANNAAMAGVAKQIVSQVSSNQTVSKKETTKSGSSTLDETFFSSNNVKSSIKLKGVTVISVKVDGKKYKATATLDMDEFTADIQFQIKRIKTDVEKLEASAREALKNRLYGKAANDLAAAQEKLPEHERLLWQLSKIYPLNDSHRLQHDLPDVESMLLAKLSTVKLQGPTETFALTKSEMPEWNVLVTDDQGPIPGFPLIAKQGRQTLAEKRTAANGNAAFLLRKVNFETGPFSIIVTPNMPLGILKASGLDQGIEVTYKVSRVHCDIRLVCNKIANLCHAAEQALSKRSVFVVTDASAPELSIDFSSTAKNTLTAGNNVMNSFDVGIYIKGERVNFSAAAKGVGKNELDATIKAVQKMDFADLQKQLAPYCK